jgi:hypothetical protein
MLHALATFDARNFYNADGSLKEIKDLDYETQLGLSGFETEHIPGKAAGIVSKIKLARPGESVAAAAVLAKYLPDLKPNSERVEMTVKNELAALSDEQLAARLNDLEKRWAGGSKELVAQIEETVARVKS